MLTRTALSSFIAAALFSSAVCAQISEKGFYGGLGLGRTHSGPSGIVGAKDDKDNAWRAFGGYQFNRYFGAFEIVQQNTSGIHFGASGSQHSLRVRNVTAGNLTLTLELLASEAAPSGQTAIAGTPPLLLRGALDTANLTYGSTAFSTAR